jgi:putative ABC transport system permease protein
MSLSTTQAVLRISWRNVRRNRWRSVLVGLLIMLPVTAMVIGITGVETVTPGAETRATWAMGVADAEVTPVPPSQPTTEQLRSRLPAGSTVEETSSVDGIVVLPGRRVGVTVRSANLDGLARGMLDLTEGRLPYSTSEVAISRSLASLAGVGIGGSIQLEGSPRQTIVGFIEDPGNLGSRVVLEHPSLADAADPTGRVWLITLPPGAPGDSLDQLYSGQDALFTANSRAGFYGGSGGVTLGTLLVGALALIETVLVGAAAFAVGIRRRQRELGLLTAAGASRRQVAATVLGEAVLLAALAAGLAVLVGVGLVALASPWLDQITNHRNGPLVIDFVAVGLAALVGVVAGVAAALVPAWTAARVPPLLALSGRRPPMSSARRTLVAGLAVIGLSVALTAAGATLLLDQATNGIAPILLVGGAILGVFGFGACSPWLVERLEWLSRHLPLAGRIALRETARARSRTAPIITATLAGLAAAVAIATIVSTQSALFGSEWQPSLRPDQFLLIGQEAPQLGPQVAREMSAVGAAGPLLPVAADGSDKSLAIVVTAGDGAAPARLDDSGGCSDCGPPLFPGVGTPDFLAAMGAEAAATDLAEGHVALLADQPLDTRSATVAVQENSLVPQSGPYGTFYPTHYTQIQQLPARAFVVGAAAHGRFPTALISEQLAARLGFEAVPEQYMFVIRLDHPVTEADVAAAASLVADSPSTYAEADFKPIDPGAVERLIVSALSMLLALTITAIAVALGEAEGRADQRTLVAVGADPGLRRRIVAARAGVIALLAAILALPAGLLPVWGLYASRNQSVALPLPELVAIVVLLPVVAMLGGLLLSRSLPPWSAFREVSAA